MSYKMFLNFELNIEMDSGYNGQIYSLKFWSLQFLVYKFCPLLAKSDLVLMCMEMSMIFLNCSRFIIC